MATKTSDIAAKLETMSRNKPRGIRRVGATGKKLGKIKGRMGKEGREKSQPRSDFFAPRSVLPKLDGSNAL